MQDVIRTLALKAIPFEVAAVVWPGLVELPSRGFAALNISIYFTQAISTISVTK
jgi:hypothetical protein